MSSNRAESPVPIDAPIGEIIELQDIKSSTTETALLPEKLKSDERSSKLSPRSLSDENLSQVNFIQDLRRRASQVQSARIDNEDLFHQRPTPKDMCTDTHISAVSIIHSFLFFISIVLLGLMVLQIKPADILLGCIAVISNLFGIIHSMYSGSITNKAEKLDAALQKLALIFIKFSKALDIQETYLDKTRILLDYLDLLLDSRLPQLKQKCREAIASKSADTQDQKEDDLVTFVNNFESQLKVEVVKQHVSWVRTLFDQFKLLDHRLAISDAEYIMLKSKLPGKPFRFFQQLVGVDRRMHELSNGTKVLPYTDLATLINKVTEDLQSDLDSPDRVNYSQSTPGQATQGTKLFQRKLSQQIQVTQNPFIDSAMRQFSNPPRSRKDEDDDIPGLDDFLANSVDMIIQENLGVDK